jgi:hypothetical protein
MVGSRAAQRPDVDDADLLAPKFIGGLGTIARSSTGS